MRACIEPSELKGSVNSLPGSKSHTIRGVIIGTLAEGVSVLFNPLDSQDTLSAVRACEAYGSKVERYSDRWIIHGLNGNLKVPDNIIDVGNSGTTMYFMTGVASLVPGWSVLTGDYQIRKRPIEELLSALRGLGAIAFRTRDNVDAPPVVVKGPIKCGRVRLSGRFSQFVSSLLIVTPLVEGKTCIEVEDPKEKPYIRMTIDWLNRSGVKLDCDLEMLNCFEINGPQTYKPQNFRVPSDWSSLAFLIAAGAITSSQISFENVDLSCNQADAVILDILRAIGTDISVNPLDNSLFIRGGRELIGFEIDCSDCPDLFPILTVLACFARGSTVIKGTQTLRYKETDRLAVMCSELSKMGASISIRDDMVFINGGGLHGAEVDSHGDHRIAMALVIAGLGAQGKSIVQNVECVSVSFPNFFNLIKSLGARVILEQS